MRKYIPVLIGGLIYIGYREKSLLMFKWFSMLGLDSIVDLYRHYIQLVKLPDLVVYSLPNGLWAYSFLEFVKSSRLLIIIVTLIIIVFEILQLFGIINGTFCWTDLIVNALGIIIFFTLHLKRRLHYAEI